MSTSVIAVVLIFAVAFLVMGIEIAHQRMTTGVIDMKAARRWFYRTVGAALVLLAGLAIADLVNFGRAREALFDVQAGSEAAKRHDLDKAITLYSKAIDAGTLNSDVQTKVLRARGVAHLQKQDWDGAVADFNETLKREDDDPETHFYLGVAFSSQGNGEAALKEFDRVIAQGRNPDDILPDVYTARGEIYSTLGQYQRGIEDFDQALRRRPKDAGAHGSRGEAYFYLAQFEMAAADFAAAGDQETKWAYYPLWLYLSLSHQGQDGKPELDRRAAKLDLKAWPGPVVQFYRGTMDEDDLLSAAREGDAKARHDQQCEADFYLGEHALLAGDKDKGSRLLTEAANTCDHRFIEYLGAKAELERLAK
jgi:lipoprotein NlpI